MDYDMTQSLNKLIETSFKNNWRRPALSDVQGRTLTYRDAACMIEELHMVFKLCCLEKGDKVGICSKNQANWGVTFLAVITYGAVPVPILNEFKPGNIHYLVNHSDCRILFVGERNWDTLSENEMPDLQAIIKVEDFELLYVKDPNISIVRSHVHHLFKQNFPNGYQPENLDYYKDSPDEIALINYTSGTSGFSKGVMLPYRSLLSNIYFAAEVQPQMDNNSNMVSMLPTAHMYGLIFEFLFEMTIGAHVWFLTRLPSPRVLLDAYSTIKPDCIIAVPLIIEKIYKKKILPYISKGSTKMMLSVPYLNGMVRGRICQELSDALGGKFSEVIIGGANFNMEVEKFMKKIGFRYTVGYGMTECGPIITYVPWNRTKLYSCGKVVPRMQIRIDSKDPVNVPGEVLLKGDNVFVGYYKNEEATNAAFTSDGWFRTGDLATMDGDGYLFLKGRIKSMILGSNGQNIYPEEIESGINNLPYVVESLVIQDKGTLTALVYPDFELAEADGMNKDALLAKLKQEISSVNEENPSYCEVANVEIIPEEFEKSPKHSIKRYLYQRNQVE
jgi:long-chain acyl-CoA synthetase